MPFAVAESLKARGLDPVLFGLKGICDPAAGGPITNTPLQAFVLLNDVTYVEAARVFAGRVMKEGGKNWDERMAWAYRRALAREPNDQEKGVLLMAAPQHNVVECNAPTNGLFTSALRSSKDLTRFKDVSLFG